MNKIKLFLAPLFAAALTAAGGCGMTPYAEMTSRDIKSLSAEDTAAYLSGGGMSLALAAELNGYPGPRHLLELADALSLSDMQREQTRRLFSDMELEAQTLGAQIVDAESRLDSLFAQKRADEFSLRESVGKIAELKGELRATHLKYHLRTVPLLSESQIARYEELRGYHSAHHH